ncbi:MAG: vanadium-dependent haloperoxidase [Polyangiaceae bacterium]|nr:vanadium-dependent haloperoxidase [Polyangiaceae bacterium]
MVLRWAGLTAAVSLLGCASERTPVGEDPAAQSAVAVASPLASSFPAHYARQWMTALANCARVDKISPPVAARTYAYGAITLYESVVHGMPGYNSLAGQLNGLSGLPQPDPAQQYDWPTVMAQAMTVSSLQTYVFPERLFFEFTTQCQATLQALGPAQIGYRQAAGVPPAVIGASMSYGAALGGAIAAWANADGYPEARYKGYLSPEGPQYWVPTGFTDQAKVANPVEPFFGTLRPLVLTNPAECAAPPPVPFSTTPGSDMYNQADAVYQTDLALTKEQREIALFWADPPGTSPTPPGHWLAIATSFVRAGNMADAVAGYATTSIGYLDSFIAVWQSKYQYNLLRPETYIRRYIDSSWRPLLETPQFPEYVSGHSGVSGTSAVTFTATFGNIPFTDATKVRRGFGARTYTSFTQAAQEASISRLYGGIHYPMGNSEGIAMGTCVGNAIVNRVHLM